MGKVIHLQSPETRRALEVLAEWERLKAAHPCDPDAASEAHRRYCIAVIDRDELDAKKGQRLGVKPTDEAQHFYQCKACGQMVDKRRLGDVFHSEDAGHEPLPMDS